MHKDYKNDTRFYDCWSKLTPFSLVEYARVVQLDSDMLVLKNMDELMDIELDPPDSGGTGKRVFAASHACCCNPLKKPHYPRDWYVGSVQNREFHWLMIASRLLIQAPGKLCVHHTAFESGCSAV